MRLPARRPRRTRPAQPRRTRVFLHVGAPLTTTPYLRRTLTRHRRGLALAGVLYPSAHVPADVGHLEAALDLRGLAAAGHPPTPGAWDRLAQTARDWWRGTVVISHELLGDADDAQVQRALTSFGRSELHVVHVARDLGRQLPAAWQEWERAGGTCSFGGYVARVLDRQADHVAEAFWASHDVEAALGRWSAYLPPSRVHLVTVPQGTGHEAAVWQRLAGLVGIDTTRFPVVEGPALEPGALPAVPRRYAAALTAEAEAVRVAVLRNGYDVRGDLDELRTVPATLGDEPVRLVRSPGTPKGPPVRTDGPFG